MENIPFKIAEQILATSWKKYCWDWFRISAMELLIKYGGINTEKAFTMVYLNDGNNSQIIDSVFIQIMNNYQGSIEFEAISKCYFSMIAHKNHISWIESKQ